jgi:hypothetical protein
MGNVAPGNCVGTFTCYPNFSWATWNARQLKSLCDNATTAFLLELLVRADGSGRLRSRLVFWEQHLEGGLEQLMYIHILLC